MKHWKAKAALAVAAASAVVGALGAGPVAAASAPLQRAGAAITGEVDTTGGTCGAGNVAFNGLKILGAFAPDSESTHGAGDFVGTVETGGSAICATITTGFTPNGNIPAIINSGTIAAHALTGTPLVSGSFCGNLTGGNFGQLGLVAIADLGINWRTSGSCATAKADASMVAVLAVVPAGALTQGAGGLKDEVVGAAYSDRLGEPSPCIDVTAGLTDSNACVQL